MLPLECWPVRSTSSSYPWTCRPGPDHRTWPVTTAAGA
jgi:hypothetical protein